jgi:hypothetical protein
LGAGEKARGEKVLWMDELLADFVDVYMGALSLLLYFLGCLLFFLTPDNGLIEATVWSSKNSLSKTKIYL